MSISIDLQDNPDSGNQPPDRMKGIWVILVAVLIFVAAVIALLVWRQRVQQAALLGPTPTVASRPVSSPGLTVTPLAQATRLPTAPPTATTALQPPTSTATALVVLAASPTHTAALPSATATTAQPAPTQTATTAAPAASPTVTTSVVEPTAAAEARQWYFGEGASVSPFRTTYAVFNPGSQAAKVTVSLYPESGKVVQRTVTVAAGSQTTVQANEILPNAAFGAGISSDQPVYVERMTVGDRDGTTSSGMTPAKVWYFPEGQTDEDFTTWLVVLNPNSMPATLTVSYYPVGRDAVVKTYTAPPAARLTIAGQKDVPSGVMGIVLESSKPVVAEHAIYFDGQKAAYGGPGITTLSKQWYVGSGNTQFGFTARVAIFNPNKEPAIVKATLIGSKQAPVSDLYSIEPMSKDDIVLNDQADEQLVAVILESDRPIAAETVTYYLSGTENGPVAAYSSPAIAVPAKQWYVPNVTPGATYDSYLTLFNPGTAAASVTVNFVTQGGETVAKTYELAASSRATLRVSDEVKGKLVIAASARSTQPIVVERVTMFSTSVGATSSAGIAGK